MVSEDTEIKVPKAQICDIFIPIRFASGRVSIMLVKKKEKKKKGKISKCIFVKCQKAILLLISPRSWREWWWQMASKMTLRGEEEEDLQIGGGIIVILRFLLDRHLLVWRILHLYHKSSLDDLRDRCECECEMKMEELPNKMSRFIQNWYLSFMMCYTAVLCACIACAIPLWFIVSRQNLSPVRSRPQCEVTRSAEKLERKFNNFFAFLLGGSLKSWHLLTLLLAIFFTSS